MNAGEMHYGYCPSYGDPVPPLPQYGEMVSVALECVNCSPEFGVSAHKLHRGWLAFGLRFDALANGFFCLSVV
jgi:hypothetical protein